MANISPFRGLRYNPDQICDLSNVISAPYDRIDAPEQAAYYDLSPYNVVRIIRGLHTDHDTPSNNVYTRANCYKQTWLAEGAMLQDPAPALYVLEQQFSTPDGATHVRRGLTAALRLTHFDEGEVLPHEHTLQGPKVDRLNLTVATETSWGHIFLLYPDETSSVNACLQPFLDSHMPAVVRDAIIEPDVEQNFWVVNDREVVNAVVDAMRAVGPAIIADGHHRYETALGYRDDMREQHPEAPHNAAFNYVLATFVSMSDPGLVVLPTHRLIHSYDAMGSDALIQALTPTFEVETMSDYQMLRGAMEDADPQHPRFGFYDGRYVLLTLKDFTDVERLVPNRDPNFQHLDVTVLHELVLEHVMGLSKESVSRRENITYLRDADEGLEAVDEGEANFLFLLNPTRMRQIQACTEAGERMPQKSTDFYPKVISGMVALPLNGTIDGNPPGTSDSGAAD
jgi:uncharacterized protein (DUF1015 family)